MSMVKMYMDGLLNTRTALIFGTYGDDDPKLGVGDQGIHYFLQNRVTTYIKGLQGFRDSSTAGVKEGFDFHIHAIGDKGVSEALTAISDAAATDVKPRHRLTHVELVTADDLKRFKTLGVYADAQVK